MGIVRDKMSRFNLVIGEIAASTARHQNLLAHLIGMVKHRNTLALLASLGGTHQAGGTATDNQSIVLLHIRSEIPVGSEVPVSNSVSQPCTR
jgi:hypothetical protein